MAAAWVVLKAALLAADRHSIPRLGAALAFYTLFSLTPVLFVVVAGASVVLERDVVQREIQQHATQFVGPEAARAIATAMSNAAVPIPSGAQAIASILVFFLGATAAFTAMLDTLNHVWDVEETHRSVVWRVVRRRLIAFGLVLVVGVFGLLSLVLSTALSGVRAHAPQVLSRVPFASGILNFLVWSVVLAVLFATIYWVVPDAQLRWRDLLVGAAFTAMVFSAGTLLIGKYIASVGIGSAFGAASSVVLVLFWVYYSAQIFLFGAEVTHAYRSYRDGTLDAR